jgi:CO/xanthine dehydrogenase Mo-binding subunit
VTINSGKDKSRPNLGAALRRNEDYDLLTGQALFVDDVDLPEMAHAAMVRSPLAHARIVDINFDAALDHDGLIAIYVAEDLGDFWAPVPIVVPPPPIPGMIFNKRTHVPLAKDKVRYVGEPVAIVIAENRYIAEDIATDIEIEYEQLPVAGDLEKAAQADAPTVHDDVPANLAAQVHQVKGDYATALTKAAKVIKRRFSYEHGMAQPMETRAIVADWNSKANKLTVWATTQAPTPLRCALAGMLDLGEQQVRVVAPFVGGGFGAKLLLYYPEDLLVPWAALRLGRPIKWVEDRGEHFFATTQRSEEHTSELQSH